MKNRILITIPHSATAIPAEISNNVNSGADTDIILSVDSGTDLIFNFKEYSQIVFPFCRAFIDVNQGADVLDDSIPIKSIKGNDLYIKTPTIEDRKKLLLYHRAFHSVLSGEIIDGNPLLIFDCHSTEFGDHDPYGDRFESEISVANMQIISETDETAPVMETCPKELMNYYVDYIYTKTGCKVATNTKYLKQTFGLIESYGQGLQSVFCPVLLTEINKNLFMDMKTRVIDMQAVENLKTVFEAGLKYAMGKYFK